MFFCKRHGLFKVNQKLETNNTFSLFDFPTVSVDFLENVEVSLGSSTVVKDATESSIST